MKKITFITTGQPTTNPRLVKEVETLIGLGYHIRVICCFYQQWATGYDAALIARYPGVFIFCGGSPQTGRWRYLYTRIIQKFSYWAATLTKRLGIAEMAISRTHLEALSMALRLPTDLYIAHNLGALPAAAMAAKKRRVKVGYDAEDLHSAQFSDTASKLYLINKYIEEKYFPLVSYFSAASPLIGKNYRLAYPYLQPVVINNVFPRSQVPPYKPKGLSGPMRLFWFSQTVGPGRGIEDVIAAMGHAGGEIELHLLGQCPDADRARFSSLALASRLSPTQLQFHAPLSPADVLEFASGFDLGLATETGLPVNRDICLTNKIFTYIQCGLPLIASDTQAQRLFIESYPDSGEVYARQDIRGLAALLQQYLGQRSLLDRKGKANYNLGQAGLNWEIESLIFIKTVKEALQLP